MQQPQYIRRRMFFIVNSAAGRNALADWERLASRLRREGIGFDHVLTGKPGDASRIARQAAGAYDIIIAAGGDGTVFEVINGMLGDPTRTPALGIVPFGTGNDTVKAFGIRNEADSWRALTQGRPQPVDLIEIVCQVNGAATVQHALSFASVGISGELLHYTTPRLKRWCGQRLAYVAGLLLALRHYSPARMKITCDGEVSEGRFIFAGASNGETFGGGMRIAPGARPDDGRFEVNIIEAAGRWEVLRHLGKLLRGTHTTHPKVRYRTALSLAIETEIPLEVAADGDLIGHTPVQFQVRPQALKLLTL